MVKRLLVLLLCSVFTLSRAQTVIHSPEQAIPYGISNIDVMGYASTGLLVREWGKNTEFIECFKDDLSTRWKKELIITDRNSRIEDVVLHNDTIIAFYSHYSKGHRILRMNVYNASLNLLTNAHTIDTINSGYSYDEFDVFTTASFQRDYVNTYFTKSDFERTPVLYQHAVLNSAKTQAKSSAVVSNLQQPDLIDVIALGYNHNAYVLGEYETKNFQNDFIYPALAVLINNNGVITQKLIRSPDVLFGEPIIKRDIIRNKLILCGMYSDNPGVKAAGTYYINLLTQDTMPYQIQFLPFTEAFVTNLIGNQQLKKNDGVTNFKPTDLLVKKDGGIIMLTESQWRSTEYIGAPGMGAFGVNNSMLITYFHYNDILAFAFDSIGSAQWYQVLRKRQSSDNDNGFYLGFSLFTGPDNMYLFYNDRVLSQQTLSAYIIDTNGNNRREEIFDNNKKNTAPIPKMSKQISLQEFVIPSFRRGYFQLIKIVF
ncbi:hypothetical protein LBMAG25_05520 [Bacteroidota bacterium]|nr:hypothetical protein LBMAG25_05520 [Bacteroidota bacterium]